MQFAQLIASRCASPLIGSRAKGLARRVFVWSAHLAKSLPLLALLWASLPARATDPVTSGQENLRAGHYALALRQFETAERQAPTPQESGKAAGYLGMIHFQLRHDELARTYLERAIKLTAGGGRELARWKSTLAHLLAAQGASERARGLQGEALALAGDDALLRAGIELGGIDLLPHEQRQAALLALEERLRTAPVGPERSAYLVHLAAQAAKQGDQGRILAHRALNAAKDGAGVHTRLQAEVLGELAQLYEEAGQAVDALQLNHQALGVAPHEFRDLLLELDWRQGRLLRSLARRDEARGYYRRAVEHVEAVRADMPLTYRDGRSAFRDTLEPLYLQYADLLLTQAGSEPSGSAQETLRLARQVVELIKQSEFEEFLGGRCAVHPVAATVVDAVEARTAVVYPIILPDRLELLVSIGGKLRQFGRPVSGEVFRDAVRRFAGSLRSASDDVLDQARTLHGWLIEPVEPWLRENQVQSLVVVPDGVMRLIPLAALHDGQRFLAERYAVSISPGLSLIAPAHLEMRRSEALLAGLDEPGDVVDHLPESFLTALAGEGAAVMRERGRALALASNRSRGLSPLDPAHRGRIREALRLPGVVEELRNLSAVVPATVLLGKDFTAARFKQELMGKPYAVVHIASHGIMGPTAESSFIMAYDQVMDWDQLRLLLRSDKFARQPLELLSLSACQTAEGDDRAPLGFSGIALKTGVRSTLGTLWPVNDQAASAFMTAFYRKLREPGVSRAKALQEAQRHLLRDKAFRHPYFWAPFSLVGDWL